jgi:guanylate kinase
MRVQTPKFHDFGYETSHRRQTTTWQSSESSVSKGPLIIISGPSASGKSVIVHRLLAAPGPPLRQSISATTRPPRPGESDGVHYRFWSRDRFEREVQAGSFLEWAENFGHLYGTPRAEVESHRQRGTGVILVIDVKGAAQVRQKCPDAVSIFIRAPSPEVYEQRLRGRGTEDEAALQRRLQEALRELACAGDYDYVVINDDLDQAVAEVRSHILGSFQGDKHA